MNPRPPPWLPRSPSLRRRDFIRLGGGLLLGAAGLRAERAALPDISLPERGLCAHRGAMDTHPENTFPAFQEAIRLGVHMIEFDIQLTKDGELVLLHDLTLDRTTDGRGPVAEWTWDALQRLDAGRHRPPRFAGTRLPRFVDTLDIMPRNIWLNCHLKGPPAVGARAAEVLRASGRATQAFLAANGAQAAEARAVFPQVLICNMDRRPDPLDYVRETIARKADFIQLVGQGEISAEHVRLLRDSGVRVNHYSSAAHADRIRHLFRQGVQFPLVNDPAQFLPVAAEFGIEPQAPLF